MDPDYLSRHDVVYQSPMRLEVEGFPLGNGNMGGLIWTHLGDTTTSIKGNDMLIEESADNRRFVIACRTLGIGKEFAE